ncbi:MAG: hypothetical protein ACE37H_08385 [Phycisphaeraceae bacterium]
MLDPRSPGEGLPRMLDLSLPHQPNWRPGELAEIFDAELRAPIAEDLFGVSPSVIRAWRGVCRERGLAGCGRLIDLIEHPSPPVGLLVLLKRYAKVHARHASAGLPQDVAKALYYLAIIVALINCGERISGLSDGQLRSAMRWWRGVPWLEGRFEQTVNAAEQRLTEGTRDRRHRS